jgi:sulfur transfer complex TusBCD TusB component (DsrH family)
VKYLSKCALISDYNPSTLHLVVKIAEKKPGLEVYLFSDAIFMLSDKRLEGYFKELLASSASIFVLEDDAKKRDIIPQKGFDIISYETLVDRLIKNDTKIYNL